MTGMPRTDEELLESLETGEWLESLDYVLEHSGPRARPRAAGAPARPRP